MGRSLTRFWDHLEALDAIIVRHINVTAEIGGGLAVLVEFTALDPTAPMTLRLNLGEADLLAGAKRYRQWLVEQGLYEPLADKLQRSDGPYKIESVLVVGGGSTAQASRVPVAASNWSRWH